MQRWMMSLNSMKPTKKSENWVSLTRCQEKAHENKLRVNRPHLCMSLSVLSVDPSFWFPSSTSYLPKRSLILLRRAELETAFGPRNCSHISILFLLLLLDSIWIPLKGTGTEANCRIQRDYTVRFDDIHNHDPNKRTSDAPDATEQMFIQ
jgi:hypothetical protein